jgi:peptide/nickel transport system substrate-binding protein
MDGSYADLPVNLGMPQVRIVPAEVLAKGYKSLDTADYGCGPFQLVEADLGRKITVKRFDGYHVAGRPYLDGVEFLLYPDLAAETTALLNGEIDVMLSVSAADYERLSQAPRMVGRRQETGRFLNAVLRMDTKPFDDRRVRQALRHAVDREALVQLVQEGFGRLAYDNVISPEYRYHVATSTPAMDIAKAKQLLAEAGYASGVKVKLFCANRPPERTALGVAMKELARPAGFDIEVQTIPYDEYIANVWRKAGFYVASWNMRPTEDAIYTQLLTSDAPWADSAFNNKEFDDAVYRARRTVDTAERARLYAAAQKLTDRELPYLVPFYQDVLSAHADYVMDYAMHPWRRARRRAVSVRSQRTGADPYTDGGDWAVLRVQGRLVHRDRGGSDPLTPTLSPFPRGRRRMPSTPFPALSRRREREGPIASAMGG